MASTSRQRWLSRGAAWLGHKMTQRIALIAIVTGGVIAVLLSPFLLLLLPTDDGVDWDRLREISQTYGATSTLVSTLALCGVATSLFIQARQSKASRLEAIRRYQLDLNRIAMEDPATYMPCIGRVVEPPGTEARQFYYTVSWMQFARLGYESGTIGEESLRGDVLAALFRGDIGRDYWAQSRQYWQQMADDDRRLRPFLRIVDDEYQQAVAAGRASVTRTGTDASQRIPVPEQVSDPSQPPPWRTPGRYGLALGAGIALGIVLQRSNRSKSTG